MKPWEMPRLRQAELAELLDDLVALKRASER